MHVASLEHLESGPNFGQHLEMQPVLRMDTVKELKSWKEGYEGEGM